jgi:hypothetical protein
MRYKNILLALIAWFAAGSCHLFGSEYIDTNGDGVPDTLQMDPFVVSTPAPGAFDWNAFWAYLNNLGYNFLTNQNEDVFFGYTTSSGIPAWEATRTSETYRGITLKGTQTDIDQVKTLMDHIANHPNQTVATEFARLMNLASANSITPVWLIGTGNITIGNFTNSLLDIVDVSKFPTSTGSGATQDSVFAHELFEQLYKQVEGKQYNGASDDAHPLAIAMEDAISGMLRGTETPAEHPDGSFDLTTRFTTEDGTLVVDQTMHFDSSRNLTSVTSVTISGP